LTPFAYWLAGGGLVGLLGLLARLFLKLHNDVVDSERRRADDAVARAIAAEKRADLREDQMAILLGRVREPTV
jgi:hypothetical protein